MSGPAAHEDTSLSGNDADGPPATVTPDAGDEPTPPRSVAAVAVVLVGVGLALRFVANGPLWLDEAQTVALVEQGVADLPESLRSDGHPPLFYALLAGWKAVLGDGDLALRALSGLISVATAVAVTGFVGRRYGRHAALATAVVVATNPFLIRYGSEVRMYALFTALVAAAWWSADRLRRDGGRAPFVATALLGAACLYTHYWALMVAAAAGIAALVTWRRGDAGSRRVVGALVVSGLLFVPWLPVLLEQLERTGTPWATTPSPASIALSVIADLGGGREHNLAALLAALLVALFLIGAMATVERDWIVQLDLRTRPDRREWVWVAVGTLTIGAAAVVVTRGGFASRYASGVALFLLLVVALGAASLRPRWLSYGVVAVVGTMGLAVAAVEATTARTQAGDIAAAIELGPGDVVVACPDQLGPALQRELGDRAAIVYPTLESANRVVWTDYEERNLAADPAVVAAQIAERVGPDGRVWLVLRGGYRTFGDDCDVLEREIAARLGAGATVIAENGDVFEPARLVVLPATRP